MVVSNIFLYFLYSPLLGEDSDGLKPPTSLNFCFFPQNLRFGFMILKFPVTWGMMNHWRNEWLHDWMIDWLIDWLNDWLNDWLIEWMNEWMNEWMSEWMNEWMNEWLSLNEWSTNLTTKNDNFLPPQRLHPSSDTFFQAAAEPQSPSSFAPPSRVAPSPEARMEDDHRLGWPASRGGKVELFVFFLY